MAEVGDGLPGNPYQMMEHPMLDKTAQSQFLSQHQIYCMEREQ